MSSPEESPRQPVADLEKCPTGIPGLDQITAGGLPRGRTTLVCGGSGSGKTLLAMEFLVKGAVDHDEPGVFMCFEESAGKLVQNSASLGFDLQALAAEKKLVIDQVHVERSELEESGAYDLEGLFIRLGYAIDSIGAKRVVLDTIEVLFGALPNLAVLRAELRRLFRWLEDRGVTAIVTGERGAASLTRHGLEEYVSDCVILLDQRVEDAIATRRLRIVKYRGSAHGTNEYPFLLDERGFTVMPLTAIGLKYPVSTEVVSTGIAPLDAMLDGGGYYRGSTMLVSGAAGAGKSSVAAHFVEAACRRGERCLYFAYEESPDQILRDMGSIGIELKPWVDAGLLRFQAMRPGSYGLETHLVSIQREFERFRPQAVVLDPISGFESAGGFLDAKVMLFRLVDLLKSGGITAVFTSLTGGGDPEQQTEAGISSVIDIWLVLRNLEQGSERTRLLYIIKARGMGHSNQVREFRLTDQGVDLVDVYMGPSGILTGSSRAAQELQDRAAALVRQREVERRHLVMQGKRRALEARIAELQAQLDVELAQDQDVITEGETHAQNLLSERIEAGHRREGEAEAPGPSPEGARR